MVGGEQGKDWRRGMIIPSLTVPSRLVRNVGGSEFLAPLHDVKDGIFAVFPRRHPMRSTYYVQFDLRSDNLVKRARP